MLASLILAAVFAAGIAMGAGGYHLIAAYAFNAGQRAARGLPAVPPAGQARIVDRKVRKIEPEAPQGKPTPDMARI